MKKYFFWFIILVCSYWLIRGMQYGLWANRRIGGGFMPVIIGALGVVLAVIVLIRNKGLFAESDFNPRAFIPVGALVAVVASSYVFGLVLSLALYIFAWLGLYQKLPCGKSALIALITSGTIYLVFDYWLMMPFPKGIFG